MLVLHGMSDCRMYATEALAACQGLQFGEDIGCGNVIVEGDSRSLNRKLFSPEVDTSIIRSVIADAKALSCRFNFVGRDGNRTAHAMAMVGKSESGDAFWIEDAPESRLYFRALIILDQINSFECLHRYSLAPSLQFAGAAHCANIHVRSAYEAEALAVCQGLQFGEDIGCGNVIVEGDSRSVIWKLLSPEVDTLIIWSVIADAKASFQFCWARCIGHHYRVDLFTASIDSQLHEINSRSNEHMIDLLLLSSTLNHNDSFKSFDIDKICLLVSKHYPEDFFTQ
ncbi:hypothetical protein GQ457_04G022880 [Hibiscus cannabinus]